MLDLHQTAADFPALLLQNVGFTALMEAAFYGQKWAVEYLVHHGADVNAKDNVSVHDIVWEGMCSWNETDSKVHMIT